MFLPLLARSWWYVPISEIFPSFITTIWWTKGKKLMPWVTKILVFLRSTPLGPMKDNIKYLNFGLHIQTKVPLYKQYFFSKWTSDQLNISLTFLSSKFDPSLIKTLEKIKFSSNQNIGAVNLILMKKI